MLLFVVVAVCYLSVCSLFVAVVCVSRWLFLIFVVVCGFLLVYVCSASLFGVRRFCIFYFFCLRWSVLLFVVGCCCLVFVFC